MRLNCALILFVLLSGCANSPTITTPAGPSPTHNPVDVLPGVTRPAVAPVPPPADVLNGSNGVVLVSVRVDSLGNPRNVEAEGSDNESLEPVAIDVVSRSTFTPALRDNERVSKWILLPVRYFREDAEGISSVRIQLDEPIDPDQSSRMTPPEYVDRSVPVYPAEALPLGLEGIVWVRMRIDPQGRVMKAETVMCSNPLFEAAALTAARQFVFKPARFDGTPISSRLMCPFKFKLNRVSQSE